MLYSRRGSPLGRWRDRVKEYMCGRGATRGGGLDQARRECLDREKWKVFCCGHPLGVCSQRKKGARAIDRYIEQEMWFAMAVWRGYSTYYYHLTKAVN